MIAARHWRLPFVLSLLGALLLAVYPLPAWLMTARPAWAVLLLVFWILREPEHVGLGTAWLAGLMFDIVDGGLLGCHALGLTVAVYAAIVLRGRLRFYSVPQQMAVIVALSAAYQLLCLWVHGVGGRTTTDAAFLMASFTTAFCWPALAPFAQQAHLDHWQQPA